MNKYGFNKDGTPVDVGVGFELVPAGEVQTDSMEYMVDYQPNKWHRNYCSRIQTVDSPIAVIAFRRPISTKPVWNKVGKGRRDVNRSIWIWRKYEGKLEMQMWNNTIVHDDLNLRQSDVTHWQYATLPEPPGPEVNEDDVAFEEYFKLNFTSDAADFAKYDCKNVWLDALEYARKEEK